MKQAFRSRKHGRPTTGLVTRASSLVAATVAALSLALVLSASARADDVLPVTNTANAGAGSLRQAILSANADPDDDLVDATGVSGTINLVSALATLSEDVEIRGPGAGALTVHRLGAFPAFRIFTVEGSEATISGLTITNGNAGAGFSHGGGIHLNAQSTLTLESSVVSGNAAYGGGGGISNGGAANSGGTVVIRNSTVSGNTTGFDGGGIENAYGEMTIRNSTVSGNTSDYAGGGIVHRGTLTVENSTVSGNQADDQAGGISSAGNNTVLTIKSSTVSANGAPEGANLHHGSLNAVASLQNTILSNPLGGGANCVVDPPPVTLTSSGYNLASDASCHLTQPTDQPSTNPDLGPLQANGGPTSTMALLPASPAIDKGIAGGLATDQRSLVRPVVFPWISNAPGGDGSDIGAFEVQTLPAPDNTFRLGKLKRNKRKGTAKLTAIVPGPGELGLSGKKVKAVTTQVAATAAGASPDGIAVVLKVRAKGKGNRKLRRTGAAKVKVNVAYTPTGGESNTLSKKLKLKKRR
jgi:hypothetical protein